MSRAVKWTKRLLLVVGIGLVAFAIAVGMRPDPVPVQVSAAVKGPLLVTVDGVGKTRFVSRQVLAAPVAGELVKISLRAGDKVEAGQVVAKILPGAPQLLDTRSKAEVVARLRSARAALVEAQNNVERSKIQLDLAEKETARNRTLVSAQALAPHALELAETEEKARRSEVDLAKSTVERIRRESEVVAVALSDPSKRNRLVARHVEVRSPFDGIVLRVPNENAGPIAAGSPLLELGDPKSMELVVDLPTQSAMKVPRGAAVRIDGLGNGVTLRGRVRLIEPSAFTKVTALGVEEQRVNVIVIPTEDSTNWTSVGDGFAADAHIEVHKASAVRKVPIGAVFRDGSHWAAFRIDANHARLTRVATGQRSVEEIEIQSGLEEGTQVVVHPSDKLRDGLEVRIE